MSASGGGTDWIQRLKDLSSVSTGSLRQSVTKLILLPIAAFFVQASNAIEAISNLVIEPVTAFGQGLASLVNSILGGAGSIVGSGAEASAAGVDVFGILGFLIALVVVAGGAFIIANLAEQEETGNLGIPFSTTDIPFVGSEEDE
jgi:hypothetical protein